MVCRSRPDPRRRRVPKGLLARPGGATSPSVGALEGHLVWPSVTGDPGAPGNVVRRSPGRGAGCRFLPAHDLAVSMKAH